jgi:hypothetical protein
MLTKPGGFSRTDKGEDYSCAWYEADRNASPAEIRYDEHITYNSIHERACKRGPLYPGKPTALMSPDAGSRHGMSREYALTGAAG